MREKDPDILVDLIGVSNDFKGEVIVQALQAEGIPATLFCEAGRMLGWLVAISVPIRVQVRRRDLEKAREVLRRTREESVDLDWDEIDVGELDDDGIGRECSDGYRRFVVLSAIVLFLFCFLMLLMVLKSGQP